MAYWSWGSLLAEHTVLCLHGLSRQGRDFDTLARSLVEQGAGRVRVICPDVVGRGQSDWLADPVDYQLSTYVQDMLALCTHLRPKILDWFGTSMGGLVSLLVAGQLEAAGFPIRRLVLNDIGPSIRWEAIERIKAFLGRVMQFESLQAAADAIWSVSPGFGPHTPEQWLELTRHLVKPLSDGKPGVALRYDPAIAIQFGAMTKESMSEGATTLWQLYDALTTQVMLLRGESSDLLTVEAAAQMVARGPKAKLVEFTGVGHAPTMVVPNQVAVVSAFLLG